MIRAYDLINYGLAAVGGGYCFGSGGEVCTPARREAWAVANPSQRVNLLTICAKWDGKKVWDCSGLFRGAWRALLQYRSGGATKIYNTWCTEKGTIDTMPELPGILLFRDDNGVKEHVALYIGNGKAVEARGSYYGVIIDTMEGYKKFSKVGWTHWAKADQVDYTNTVEPPDERPALYSGYIKTKYGNGVTLWRDNTKKSPIAAVPEGALVDILSEPDDKEFADARIDGRSGMLDLQYVVPADGETPSQNSYMARIINVTTGLNLRTSPHATTNTIMLIPPGAIVEVYPEQASGLFNYVHYAGNTGYATAAKMVALEVED